VSEHLMTARKQRRLMEREGTGTTYISPQRTYSNQSPPPRDHSHHGRLLEIVCVLTFLALSGILLFAAPSLQSSFRASLQIPVLSSHGLLYVYTVPLPLFPFKRIHVIAFRT
jgi:hypothetical protein